MINLFVPSNCPQLGHLIVPYLFTVMSFVFEFFPVSIFFCGPRCIKLFRTILWANNVYVASVIFGFDLSVCTVYKWVVTKLLYFHLSIQSKSSFEFRPFLAFSFSSTLNETHLSPAMFLICQLIMAVFFPLIYWYIWVDNNITIFNSGLQKNRWIGYQYDKPYY